MGIFDPNLQGKVERSVTKFNHVYFKNCLLRIKTNFWLDDNFVFNRKLEDLLDYFRSLFYNPSDAYVENWGVGNKRGDLPDIDLQLDTNGWISRASILPMRNKSYSDPWDCISEVVMYGGGKDPGLHLDEPFYQGKLSDVVCNNDVFGSLTNKVRNYTLVVDSLWKTNVYRVLPANHDKPLIEKLVYPMTEYEYDPAAYQYKIEGEWMDVFGEDLSDREGPYGSKLLDLRLEYLSPTHSGFTELQPIDLI